MTSVLRVKKLTQYARIPFRGSKDAAGFDLISAYDYTIYPKTKQVCKLIYKSSVLLEVMHVSLLNLGSRKEISSMWVQVLSIRITEATSV